MGRKPNNYNNVIHLLQELHTLHPTYTMAMHLATALDGYHDFWGVTDKELLFALNKYKVQLELDSPITEDKDIEKIIKDGMNLSLSSLIEDEDADIREQDFE